MKQNVKQTVIVLGTILTAMPALLASLVVVRGVTPVERSRRRLHPRSIGARLSVAAMRRRAFYQPLAVVMAVLLTPVASLAGSTGSSVSSTIDSIEQLPGACTATPDDPSIIRNYCVTTPQETISYALDLKQLERQAVNAYLGEHKLTEADASVIYQYGRSDLRSAVRANIFEILKGIINTDPAARSDYEQRLYNWLSALVQKNEVALYQNAVDQFNLWQNNPCHFTMDSTIASVYNLSYDGSSFCASRLTALFGGPPVPAESYFTAYGMRKSYAAVSDTHPNFSALVSQTTMSRAEVAGIATAASTVVVVGSTAAIAASVLLAMQSGQIAAETAYVLSATTVTNLGPLAVIAGPAAIILIAVAIGVAAGTQVFENEAVLNNLRNLVALRDRALSTPPDLRAFVNDTTGLGTYKIQMTMVAQTVPDVPATNPLPQHQPNDLNFVISSSGSTVARTTLGFEDWDGNDRTVQTWGGWFVGTCAGATCANPATISASFPYVDGAGVKWTASRLGDRFTSIKAKPDADDLTCVAATETGVSPGSNFSNCRTYVSKEIPVRDANGNTVRVSLSPRRPPVFSDIVSLPFNPGFASTRTITVTGDPVPDICYVSGSLPNGFSINTQSCDKGSFAISYDGSADAPGQYPFTLTALNAVGTVTKQFTIDFTTQLAITSSGTIPITGGFPVHFTVTATGNPAPALSVNPAVQLSNFNLTFTDNGDGTGTISGFAPASIGSINCFLQGGDPCGIIATNSQGTVEQQVNFKVNSAPSARLVPPAGTQFLAGARNEVPLRTNGAVTPVAFSLAGSLVNPEPPAWLTLEDLGDGTAVLRGTPPLGTSGTIDLRIYTVAVGSAESVNKFLWNDYQLNVTDQPAFTSPNTATFNAGTLSDFHFAANQGDISLIGTLPQGLTFLPGISATINGTPAAGTGGSYTVAVAADAGKVGTAQQTLQLNIYGPPKITSDNKATFVSGSPGMFAVTTTGFPVMSTAPVPERYDPPTDPAQGLGMYFTVAGLPPGLQVSNLNANNFATGTLTIEGTPTSAGTYPVSITAVNGVGAPAQQTLMLTVVSLTGPAPVSGSSCNGVFNGTFTGNMTVSAGQNCHFIGGRINGNVAVSGGSFSMSNIEITGNVSVQGNAALAIDEGTHIGGSLTIQNVSSAVSTNRVCGASVASNLSLFTNATAIAVGSPDIVACSGNAVGGNLTLQGNTGATTVYNNFVNKNLACTSNASITGGGNDASKKNGQCSAF